jgi:hypothetical protein
VGGYKRAVLAGKKVEFVSSGMWYRILRGHWCVISLNGHAPTEVKIDDVYSSIQVSDVLVLTVH